MVKIAVIGCGLMGTKIAGEMAYHGHRVKLYDANIAALNLAHERIEADKAALVKEGLLPNTNLIGQILCIGRLQDTVSDADFILEAVVDDLVVKQTLFKEVSKYCPRAAIIATNTLHLDVNQIAEGIECNERMVGLRFLFPVYQIAEVEITTSRFTAPETIDKVHTLMQRMGKVLFFRSGSEPLILSEEQRELRRLARLEQLSQSQGSLSSSWRQQQGFDLSHDPSSQQQMQEQSDLLLGADKDCAICMDRARDCLLCPCHHLVTCSDCAQSLLSRRDGCPICRKDISQVIHVYHS